MGGGQGANMTHVDWGSLERCVCFSVLVVTGMNWLMCIGTRDSLCQ